MIDRIPARREKAREEQRRAKRVRERERETGHVEGEGRRGTVFLPSRREKALPPRSAGEGGGWGGGGGIREQERKHRGVSREL